MAAISKPKSNEGLIFWPKQDKNLSDTSSWRFSCMGNSIPYSNLGYNVEKLLEIHIYRQKMLFWGQINCLLLLEFFCFLWVIFYLQCAKPSYNVAPSPLSSHKHTHTHPHAHKWCYFKTLSANCYCSASWVEQDLSCLFCYWRLRLGTVRLCVRGPLSEHVGECRY